jgi:hypothetical protein
MSRKTLELIENGILFVSMRKCVKKLGVTDYFIKKFIEKNKIATKKYLSREGKERLLVSFEDVKKIVEFLK